MDEQAIQIEYTFYKLPRVSKIMGERENCVNYEIRDTLHFNVSFLFLNARNQKKISLLSWKLISFSF